MASMLDIARVVVPLHFYDPPTAVAVAWAESRGVTTAVRIVTARKPTGEPERWHGSRDRGTWQFNSYFHPEVPDICAFDLACAAKEAFRVSAGGHNWSPWNTWRLGAHIPFITQAAAAIAQAGPAPSIPTPEWWAGLRGRPLRTIRLLDGPLLEIGYCQDVLRRVADQHVATTAMFDTPTCTGVKNLQRFFALKPDGIVGPQTWPAIHYLSNLTIKRT